MKFEKIFILALTVLISLSSPSLAQKTEKQTMTGTPVMWEKVDVASQDTFLGPGGAAMKPDVTTVTYIADQKGGFSTKYRVKDNMGRIWVAKIGAEAQPETAAVRLLSALGYRTEVNYLVPKLTITGKGEFTNVRLEARPADVERMGQWEWSDNPFKGTREFQGLKVMMSFFNNWDMKSANNVILKRGDDLQYVISDLGVSFGKTGSNGLPIFWMVGRSRNVPEEYAESTFVKDLKEGKIKFAFNGKNMGLLNDITVDDGRWLAGLLTQLTDKQIDDAFRAANYSDADRALLVQSVKNRIRALDLATQGVVVDDPSSATKPVAAKPSKMPDEKAKAAAAAEAEVE